MTYTGTSIVDYLKSIGKPSDYASRAALAKQSGISNYTGSAEQNKQLLGLLNKPSPTPVPPAKNPIVPPVPPVPPVPTPPLPSAKDSLKFKSGLSDSQKKQLQSRLDAINSGSPISQTDIDNFNYGLGTSWKTYVPADKQVVSSNPKKPDPIVPPGEEKKPMVFDDKTFSDYPAELKNTDIWKNSSAYDKLMLYTTFKAKEVQDPLIQKKMMEALGTAMESLDPYYKMKTRMANDAIERSAITINQDYASKIKSNEEKIRQTEEDLLAGREYLTLEQQAEMGNQLREFKNNLYSLRQNAAESGLAFSSPRETAEQQLNEQQAGLAESTTRKFNKSQTDLANAAARDTLALQQNAKDLERGRSESLTDLSRKGEELLGSTAMPQIPGVTLLGGIQGTQEAEKQAKALNYGTTIQEVYKENI